MGYFMGTFILAILKVSKRFLENIQITVFNLRRCSNEIVHAFERNACRGRFYALDIAKERSIASAGPQPGAAAAATLPPLGPLRQDEARDILRVTGSASFSRRPQPWCATFDTRGAGARWKKFARARPPRKRVIPREETARFSLVHCFSIGITASALRLRVVLWKKDVDYTHWAMQNCILSSCVVWLW